MKNRDERSRAVYSTDPGWTPPADPPPPDGPVSPAQASSIRVRLERKGRGGKVVTVLSGLPGPAATLADLARDLRAACGAGGTVRDREIEIQGDQRARVEAHLSRLGFGVKRSGG